MITEATMRRLAFVRYMYDLGMDQSHQPEPMCAVSVLTFHDCAELFLQLVAEQIGASTSVDTPFMGYWQRINDVQKKNGQPEMGHDSSMRRLVDARKAFKHGGTLPHQMTIEMVRAALTAFLEDTTPLIFGLVFDDLSMLSLVACEPARQSLEEAQRLIGSGELAEALAKTAMAFAQLLHDYGERVFSKFGRYPRFYSPYEKDMGLERSYIDKMVTSGTDFEHEMKVMSLNIDYRRYQRFWLLTPLAFADEDDAHQTQIRNEMKPLTPEDCRFCIEFVIDSAIRLQELDFDLQP